MKKLRFHSLRVFRAAAGLALLLAVPARAQVGPLGSQFQINASTTNLQGIPSIARLGSGGNFVVVWESQISTGTDSDGYSVQGQLFNASATPVGAEFQVNTYTTSTQYYPSVAADSAGNFVVIWESLGSSGTDASGLSIQGQRFNASATPVGAEFQVNTYTNNDQRQPSAAMDTVGNFVVAWHSNGASGGDTSQTRLCLVNRATSSSAG